MTIDFASEIAAELKLPAQGVAKTIQLFDDDATVPFIARYRKEATGNLDEEQITNIRDRLSYLRKLEDRKKTVLKTIEEQGKLTDELKDQIEACRDAVELEDIYLPYKPKRKTRATMAIEKGLEPLADLIWAQGPVEQDADSIVAAYIDEQKGVPDADTAWAGARDIVAERVSETKELREKMRKLFLETGTVVSKVKKKKEKAGIKFKDYFDFDEPARSIPSHRMLAIRRGEGEEILSFRILVDRDTALGIVRGQIFNGDGGPFADQLKAACDDGFDRLLTPSIEGFARNELRLAADREAIKVFAMNLRKLLMSPPLGGRWVLAIDPGIRTGCKVVALDDKGDLLAFTVIYPDRGEGDRKKAEAIVEQYCNRYRIEAVAIGNGTGGREVERFFRKLERDQINDADVFMVSEAGASVYSASEVARKEFPDQDITVRGAISIGRRVQDPLAELVKIEPKSIGVGQYQHDVDQDMLKDTLGDIVVSCVNAVGVELNTASPNLLSYVAGLNSSQAQSIIGHRTKNGHFKNRKEILDVAKIGPKTFEQAAGFLRIQNGNNPLDKSAVHPERYELVEKMAQDIGTDVGALVGNKELITKIKIADYVTDQVGEPTLNDILAELAKPGRDPRPPLEPIRYNPDVTEVAHLNEGMILDGVVTNVTNFGAFVDIGVHQDGLVHVSELSHDFVTDPSTVVEVEQRVKVRVVEVDRARTRISLSIKQATEPPKRPARPAPYKQKARPKQQKDFRQGKKPQNQRSRREGPKFTPFAKLFMENGKVKMRDDED